MCNTLVYREGVDFKVTCFKFMTVFITRRDAAFFLAIVTTILPLCLPGNSTFYAPFDISQQTAVMLDESRGREASTGWVWGLLSGHSREEGEGERDDNKDVCIVDKICNSAGHK